MVQTENLRLELCVAGLLLIVILISDTLGNRFLQPPICMRSRPLLITIQTRTAVEVPRCKSHSCSRVSPILLLTHSPPSQPAQTRHHTPALKSLSLPFPLIPYGVLKARLHVHSGPRQLAC